VKPLVSILIPAYNAERWVAETLRSALAQTWSRKEVILVDDGSTDRTLDIVRQFEGPELKIVAQANAGAAAARNRAFAECQGDYIQWLDADDLLDPVKISEQLELLEGRASNRTLLSSAWGQFIFRPHRAEFVPTPLWQDLFPIEWLLLNLRYNYWMQTAVWLVSRELTQAAGPWDARLLGDDDGEYFCRVIVASDCVKFASSARVFYRRTPSSLSYVGRSRRKLEAHFFSKKLRVAHTRSLEDSERVRQACVEFLKSNLYVFYPEIPEIIAETQQLVSALGGGRLEIPRLPWKYAWIQKAFGWTAAKEAQVRFNHSKASAFRCWDRALLALGM